MSGEKREMTYVVTSTYYSEEDVVRSRLAKKFADGVAELPDTELIMIDGGSCDGFRNEILSNNPDVMFLPQSERGMDAARLQGFRVAKSMAEQFKATYGDASVAIQWSEPEKVGFVKFIPTVVRPILAGTADVVIPNRLSMESYPYFQMLTETAACEFVSQIVGVKWDQFFGPVAASFEGIEHFIHFDSEKHDRAGTGGYGRIHLPRFDALKQGMRVKTVEIDYRHPQGQTEEEAGNMLMNMKRVRQLHDILSATLEYAQGLGLTN
jgi:hypothetical protein